ncbi:ATP-binding protein [Hyperthermus butylicus]|uniref:ATPase domain-containing protein n=1 Tax=Hyperthermus butylicus (strain DSM 5456 / JCM 9403 / PLM1-5) TaxID=415426 RepID=A2BMV5_HYPBU|nr:ATP-binding protein [Hyperthermus butylicus]ABM81316.1 hypothetical protein Hbut_1494 [Hyperthermus butylicus DSM 5456]
MQAGMLGRSAELRELLSLAAGGGVYYVYGPRGVGVSSLLRWFISSLAHVSGYAVAYVDGFEGEREDLAVSGTPLLVARFRAAVSPNVPVGRGMVLALPVVVGGFPAQGLRIVVVVDHVDRVLGGESLRGFAEGLAGLAERLVARGAVSVAFFLAGRALGARMLRGVAEPVLVEGIDATSYAELARRLGAPQGFNAHGFWELTQGNPGELVLLAHRYLWNVEFWRGAIAARLRRVARLLEARGLQEELARAVEEGPDAASPRLLELLEAHDVVYSGEAKPLQDRKVCAAGYCWQLPVYREVLGELLGVGRR